MRVWIQQDAKQDFAIPPPPPGAGIDLYPVPVRFMSQLGGVHDGGKVARDNAEIAALARAGGLEAPVLQQWVVGDIPTPFFPAATPAFILTVFGGNTHAHAALRRAEVIYCRIGGGQPPCTWTLRRRVAMPCTSER